MSGEPQTPNLFSPSAFSTLISMRRYMAEHYVDASAASSALMAISPDFASGNHALAAILHARLPTNITFQTIIADHRQCLEFLIEEVRPWWRKVFPAGRSHVGNALTEDEHQTLSDAGLFQVPPDADVMAWWYRIQSKVRAETDTSRSEQGGSAELRTIAYEEARLSELGIDLRPELVGFENNGLGFDVKSYDLGPAEPVARLIEVKSSTANPPRMFVPRSEWEEALKYGPAFFFYLWHGKQAETLTILTGQEVAAHMPADMGAGEWQEVEVRFPNL